MSTGGNYSTFFGFLHMVLHKKGLLCFYGFHGAIPAPAHHPGLNVSISMELPALNHENAHPSMRRSVFATTAQCILLMYKEQPGSWMEVQDSTSAQDPSVLVFNLLSFQGPSFCQQILWRDLNSD